MQKTYLIFKFILLLSGNLKLVKKHYFEAHWTALALSLSLRTADLFCAPFLSFFKNIWEQPRCDPILHAGFFKQHSLFGFPGVLNCEMGFIITT